MSLKKVKCKLRNYYHYINLFTWHSNLFRILCRFDPGHHERDGPHHERGDLHLKRGGPHHERGDLHLKRDGPHHERGGNKAE
jgi:hypothetical protein